jgi:hypothetical protein
MTFIGPVPPRSLASFGEPFGHEYEHGPLIVPQSRGDLRQLVYLPAGVRVALAAVSAIVVK